MEMFYENLEPQWSFRCFTCKFAEACRLLPKNILCKNSKSPKHNQTIEQADTKTCDLWRYKF